MRSKWTKRLKELEQLFLQRLESHANRVAFDLAFYAALEDADNFDSCALSEKREALARIASAMSESWPYPTTDAIAYQLGMDFADAVASREFGAALRIKRAIDVRIAHLTARWKAKKGHRRNGKRVQRPEVEGLGHDQLWEERLLSLSQRAWRQIAERKRRTQETGQ